MRIDKISNLKKDNNKSEIYSFFLKNKTNGIFILLERPLRAVCWYKNYMKNLLTGEIKSSSIYDLKKRLKEIEFNKVQKNAIVMHLFYELGQFFVTETSFDDSSILSIEIEYADYKEINLKNIERKSLNVKPLKSPTFEAYKKAFLKGRKHLIDGDCYQFNLTFPFTYLFDKSLSPQEIINHFWKNKDSCGDYAHATYIKEEKKLYLSNSPECLFQAKKLNDKILLWSMPIKGSLKINNDKSLEDQWKELSSCKKNQAELYMITDLLRNDLSKIENPVAKVIKKKSPLVVPKILHQYSLVSVKLGLTITLLDIIKGLFPGGSITGAPKRRVMKILKSLEKENRGFYCGSTILIHKSILASSINIRSGVFNFNTGELTYNAGGGITILSEVEEEFMEMMIKVQSFVDQL